MSNVVHLPPKGSVFDTDTNCALNTCPLDRSIYTYRPSIAANSIFIALFGISLIIHMFQGVRNKSWWFSGCMSLGCICEVIGYAGRVIVWQNPFSFNGFLLQIICITIAPAFFSAAIYLTLSQIVNYLGPQYSRFPPSLYLWIFIPCDIVALTLQGTGGGMSATTKAGSNPQTGVNISIAGLSFQVGTLSIFVLLAADYFFRYARKSPRSAGSHSSSTKWTGRFKVFLGCLGLAILLIFIRCAFRIDELKEGYGGKEFHNEPLFIGLESVMVTVAAFLLNVVAQISVVDRRSMGGMMMQGKTEDLEGKDGYGNQMASAR